MWHMSNDTDNLMELGLVRHIGGLSLIAMTDEQAQTFGRQMATLLTYFDGLRTVDTHGVEPMIRGVDLVNVLGPDVPHTSLTPDAALANAPDRDGGYFKVPKVLGDS